MPRSPARNSLSVSKTMEEEARIMERFKTEPQLFDLMQNFMAGGGRKKMHENLEEIAQTFECSVDTLQKMYLKCRPTGEGKKSKEIHESRPRSGRSFSSESSTRRSLRLAGSQPATIESTDVSCASSSCGGTPRPSDDKKQSSQEQQNRSMRSRALNSIKESEAAPDGDSANADNLEKASDKSEDGASCLLEKENVPDSTIDPTTTALKQENSPPVETKAQSRSLRFSEPPHNGLQQANSGSRRKPATNPRSPRMNLNPEDPTRVFFESMGLTVANFPQHVQATVKQQVSEIVHGHEYELSSPASVPSLA